MVRTALFASSSALGMNPADFTARDWTDFGISALLMIGIGVVLFFMFHHKRVRFSFLFLLPLSLLALLFHLYVAAALVMLTIFAIVMIGAFTYSSEFSEMLQSPLNLFHPGAKKNVKKTDSFDREKLYKDVETSVLRLSEKHTGALITFQKKDKIEIPQDATILDAPFVPELVETIFYTGTRLHDMGMVVIGNIIHAASVQFPTSNKAFSGKVGARHRAAVGISERTDSVTVVVSEETGRIHIAYRGTLTPCTKANFLTSFKSFMEDGNSTD
ncbi:MAG TPA: hypothetical protein DEA32_02330 [Firmicutes bacterium]|nr:hypothetical protein [Bacillota bacterium]